MKWIKWIVTVLHDVAEGVRYIFIARVNIYYIAGFRGVTVLHDVVEQTSDEGVVPSRLAVTNHCQMHPVGERTGE